MSVISASLSSFQTLDAATTKTAGGLITPLEKKTDDAAKNLLKQDKKALSCKKFIARVFHGFCSIIVKIFSCVRKCLCCCCLDEEYSYENSSLGDDISDDFSFSNPLDEVEDFFEEIYAGQIPDQIDFKLETNGLKKTKSKNLDTDVKYRERREQKILRQAQEIAMSLSSKQASSEFTVQGQGNQGNSCYMNSALQCLENTYGIDHEECLKLTSQDLSLQDGETLEELENRLLHIWAPISELTDADKLIRKDRILFKWSYLIVLQAKLNKNPETIKQALRLHHRVCFEVGLHPEFKDRPYQQKDAASYLEYWHDVMGIRIPVAMQMVSRFENKNISLNIKVVPESVLQIPLGEIKKAMNLVQLLEARFFRKILPKQGDTCTFELPEGKEVKLKRFNEISRISSKPPKFLTFQFKRFVHKSGRHGYSAHKILDPLPIDLKTDLGELDFSPFFRKSLCKDEKCAYVLTSFIVHIGEGLGSGHYVSYVKRKDGQWYCCNDSRVKKVAVEELPIEDAYTMSFALVD